MSRKKNSSGMHMITTSILLWGYPAMPYKLVLFKSLSPNPYLKIRSKI